MKRNILVADDEEGVRRALARILDPSRFDVLLACDGHEAIEIARSRRPDLVLLDLNLPGQSGWEVLRLMRGDARTRTIPVILVTGYGDVSVLADGLRLGADDYVAKPFVGEEIKARVEGALLRSERDLSANPLTRLPGSPAVEAEIGRRIREGAPFAFLYLDIDHFKPYNDVYGFARGDRVIRALARLLLRGLEAEGGGNAFAGHIGGDDFVAVVDPELAPHVAQRLAAEFDRLAPRFYGLEDRRRGFIKAEDRRGRRRRFAPLTLSIGVVTTQRRRLDHHAKVVRIASEMKAYLKSRPGRSLSAFAFDRRSDF